MDQAMFEVCVSLNLGAGRLALVRSAPPTVANVLYGIGKWMSRITIINQHVRHCWQAFDG